MDLQIPYSILLAFFCFLLVFLNIVSKKSTKNLPPGPWRLPIIGNIHQFLNGSHPHHTLHNLSKKYGPIMYLQLGELSNIVVTSPEILKEVFKTHDINFSNRPHQFAGDTLSYGRINILFSSYGSYWRELRKICTLELLTAKRVQSFQYIRQEEVAALLKDVRESEGSAVNLTKKLFMVTNSITTRAVVGKRTRDQENFLECLEEVIRLCEGFTIADLFPSIKVLRMIGGMTEKVMKIHKEIDRIFENIIREHKERRVSNEDDQDLVDVLLKIQQKEDKDVTLADNNIKAVIMDIFSGGTDTSATTMEWTMAELMRNPKVMKEVQAEVRRVYDSKGFVDETELHQLKYLKLVIKETLRLHAPIPLLVPRENSESCVINGYQIPANSKLIVNFWSMARDPKHWVEPEKFKPERFLDNPIDFKGTNFEYIPFGAGRKMCPGITFATPMFELPLSSLLYHFDWKLLDGMKPEELDMSETFGATVKRKADLCLIPICSRPSFVYM